MTNYKHIVIAIDFHPDCDKRILERGIKVAREYGAAITLLHGVDHINAYGVAQAYPTVLELEEEMVKEATQKLQEIKKTYELTNAIIKVEIGSPKMVIIKEVKDSGADLIVLGSHGRHGLQLLLGSTANAILHHAPCDVLTVRVEKV